MPICKECKQDREDVKIVYNPLGQQYTVCTDCWFHKYEPNGLGGYDKKIVL